MKKTEKQPKLPRLTLFVLTGKKENRIRALKSRTTLENMHPDDENIYAPNVLDKYAHRPDRPTEMNNMCLADFATMYVHHEAYEPEIESDDIRNYVNKGMKEMSKKFLNLNKYKISKKITITRDKI